MNLLKNLLFTSLFFILACSKDPTTSPVTTVSATTNINIKPPKWIQGKWYQFDGGGKKYYRHEFTSDDYFLLNPDGTRYMSHKQLIDSAISGGGKPYVVNAETVILTPNPNYLWERNRYNLEIYINRTSSYFDFRGNPDSLMNSIIGTSSNGVITYSFLVK